MRHAVLFDIDGTLMRAGGAGREALARGAAIALDLPLETARRAAEAIDFRGRIDPLLVDELVRRLGGDPRVCDGRVIRCYLELLPETLAVATVELLPGVRELVERLDRRGDVVVGLLTGNVREGARLKLARVGLDYLADRPGGFGEDGQTRIDVARHAVVQMMSAGVPAGNVVVVGDTEHDVGAGKAAGARTVAVATGWTPLASLEASGPDALLPDLSDPAGLLELLGSE
jgi:phosphoglycolate phosphatase